MDIVDTLNHLIPSDQLDESLIIGQNIDCEATNDFGTDLVLDDSLKNMLSDKDPMFGCASSQFNLLDTEDSAFPVSTTTGLEETLVPEGLEGELTSADSTQVKGVAKKRPSDSASENDGEPKPANACVKKIPRGRPGRKPVNRVQRSFLIEKGVKGAQLKKELTEGGRINVNDLHGGSLLNPTVELRRLTVTIGGFRIELLPGPSYSQNDDTTQSASFDDGMSYGANVGFPALTGDSVNVQNPVPDNTTVVDVIEKSTTEDLTVGLGPYVNPNDVQTSNGTLKRSPSTQEAKVDNHNVPKEQNSHIEAKADIKQSQINDSKTTVSKTEVKEKQHILSKNLVKSKQESLLNKNKDLETKKPSSVTKENIGSPNTLLKNVQVVDLHKMKSLKDKKDLRPLKRPAENSQGENAGKVQKLHSSGDGKVRPKLPTSPSSLVKKSPVAANCVGDHPTPGKHAGSKGEGDDLVLSRPAHTSKTPDEGGQEKSKVKKPEKIHQRQKSKSARSISVEEPQLFIPDNAPAAKKEATEDQSANSETIWDGNNSCGLCKKPHNNMFMVGCGRCDDWFHGDCVGLDLTKVREMEEQDQMYVCLKCCEEEGKKQEPESSSATKPDVHTKSEAQDHKLPSQPRPGPSQTHSSGGDRTVRKDSDRRLSSDGRDSFYRSGSHTKHESKSKSSASKKPVSVDAIRRSVRDSLKEILTQRLKESDLNISTDRASEVAKKTERELFHLYKDTDNKYKNKYRSLMFNLKDSKNNVLFRRVLKGEISPANLIRMSPEELASKELAAWRQRENRHTIEMIEKEQREAERRPITKITHKGEIEIESQEPVKAPEPVDLEPLPKVTEEPAEPPKTPEKKTESTKTEKDTTSQHKSHLFDLRCKICTGRMVAPAEEAPTKVVKVATTVVRRQSSKMEESRTSTPPAAADELHLNVVEESLKNTQSSYETKSEHGAGRDEEASFLSNLTSLWRGFIHMHNVAKLVTKAFPVSGVLDNLTHDLQDSIQVGGRITPQMVWDYLEKIRASGTKEVCLIRFSPESDEDEISYALLYAYFSSRKRFGVVSNNLKQVKDMYLIPLGATEKVPHQLVPFDGPGLENNRANLLLGLIIRQRPKRDYIAVDVNETGCAAPEIKPITISSITKETRAPQETENFFLSALITTHKKEKAEALNTTDEPVAEAFEGPSVLEETNNQEAPKPLRFLPGVLVGWGGELPPLPDVGGTSSVPAENPPKIQPPPRSEASTRSPVSPAAAAPRERFVIKKKESKPAKADPEISSPTRASAMIVPSVKDAVVVTPAAQISLKDKPPDVSTEAFLASLSEPPCETESSRTDSKKGQADVPSETEKEASGGNSLPHSKPQPATEQMNVSAPPVSGILKKTSASPSVENTVVLQQAKRSPPAPLSPKPVPVLGHAKNDPVTPFHQGYLQLFQAKNKQEEESQTVTQTKGKHDQDQPDAAGTPPAAQRPPPAQPVTTLSGAASPASQQPQVLGSCNYSSNPPTNTLSSPNAQNQDQIRSGASENTSQVPAPPALDPLHPESSSQSPKQLQQPSLPRQHRRPEEHYWDPWERPRTERSTEDRDHQGKHGHHRDSHHEKKSRHQEREREKKHERGYEDKYREKSRHHGHSDDRHGEKRKERHNSDDHSSRHKDRHRHRRDSDYENGRRSSKDSYS